MESAKAVDAPLAVGLLDLDDFRRVDDLRGHDGGVRLLVACVRGPGTQHIRGDPTGEVRCLQDLAFMTPPEKFAEAVATTP